MAASTYDVKLGSWNCGQGGMVKSAARNIEYCSTCVPVTNQTVKWSAGRNVL